MKNDKIVVVADNDDDARQLVADALRRLGFSVVEACNGNELVLRANELLNASQPISIVVSDIGMPGCDGIEAARRLRSLAPSLPVILMTAFGDAGVHQRAQQAGARRLLRKPFSLSALSEAVFASAA